MPNVVRRLTRHHRPGFTLPEILIVIVMISVLALLAIPRFALANGKRHLESARMRVTAGLVTARQAAIQKGQTVLFRVANDTVAVTASGLNLMSPVPINTLYKVRATTSTNPLVIEFTSRGFANLSGSERIILTRAGTGVDTLTVAKTGMVQR